VRAQALAHHYFLDGCVMALYTVTLRASTQALPGAAVERHTSWNRANWRDGPAIRDVADPFPKPSYLSLLVAGRTWWRARAGTFAPAPAKDPLLQGWCAAATSNKRARDGTR